MRIRIENDRLKSAGVAAVLGALTFAATVPARAEVPENIYQSMLKIGQIVDPACTAMLYRPFMPANDVNSKSNPVYPGITVTRDISFGSNPKDLLDVFTADSGPASRPVLIFVPGGGGNKTEQQNREANAFYDNIARWATKNGMVGVLMQRHPGQGWDAPAKDVATMIGWLQANAAKYKGDASRMFIWAHSAGNGPVGTYLGRPELHGPKGPGLKGAIMMSGGWNIAPLMMPDPSARPAGPAFGGQAGGPPPAGSTCHSESPFSAAGAIAGPSGATPMPAGAPRAGGSRPSRDELLQHSTLEGLKKSDVKLMFASAELDPGVHGGMSEFYQTLHDELCKLGPAKCPTMLYAKRHNHMSLVFSPDSPDTTVTAPVLQFIRSVK